MSHLTGDKWEAGHLGHAPPLAAPERGCSVLGLAECRHPNISPHGVTCRPGVKVGASGFGAPRTSSPSCVHKGLGGGRGESWRSPSDVTRQAAWSPWSLGFSAAWRGRRDRTVGTDASGVSPARLSRAPSALSLHDERPQALRDERPQPLRHGPHGAPRPHLHPGAHREGGAHRGR